MPTMDEKAKFLVREGLVRMIGSELMLSTCAVALLTGTAEESWASAAVDTLGAAQISDAFGRDIRRGAAEARARIGSSDPVDVLYKLVAPRELRRRAEVDEYLKEMDV